MIRTDTKELATVFSWGRCNVASLLQPDNRSFSDVVCSAQLPIVVEWHLTVVLSIALTTPSSPCPATYSFELKY